MLDGTVVAPDHCKVMLENDRVRLLRISYRPFQSAAMHSHPDSVVVCRTEMNGYFGYPDGRTEEMQIPARAAGFVPPTTHAAGQTIANRFEAYLIELKD